MMEPRLPEEKSCFGCGACCNVCPKEAISMEYSIAGFLVPVVDHALCIHCGKCEKACPTLHPIFDNSKEPDFYAFCANDEIRKKSTSGGMFTLLAMRTLKHGGKVCGALYDDNMQLHHVVTDDLEWIDRMRGSKYLQSNTERCYETIKQHLESGTEVLFTGTPCQVAGLYGALGKKYDNLVAVDLLCHGAPSQLFFNAYMKEMENNNKVTNVEFRSKRFGWKWSNILTTFSDGTERIGDKTDPYKVGFSGKLMCRETCYHCTFSDFPRQGDITIGDLWESAKLVDRKINNYTN